MSRLPTHKENFAGYLWILLLNGHLIYFLVDSCVASRFPDLVPSRFPVMRPLGFLAAEPWLFWWLAGAFWAAVPCGVLAPVLWAVGLLPPPFLLANVEVGGCLFPSSFPIYYGCFVEDGLVDFGEFISIKPEGLPSLRASLLLRLLLQNLRVFFVLASYLFLLYANDHFISMAGASSLAEAGRRSASSNAKIDVKVDSMQGSLKNVLFHGSKNGSLISREPEMGMSYSKAVVMGKGKDVEDSPSGKITHRIDGSRDLMILKHLRRQARRFSSKGSVAILIRWKNFLISQLQIL
ncbi:hypothetical protein M5K25_028405 [Dendrobium thyrsiflorum]|uniref:Uncharacterized protein n=1 Tax=Dendrobium thyrsiflorum TaxID=117978 RepID=A0ABD0TTC9_DENTH